MPQIFISYSRVDSVFVTQLYDSLRRMRPSWSVWYDQAPDGLLGGDSWWDEILNAIAKSDIFIYVLSNESVQSAYCQAEFQEARRLQKRIITIQARDRTKIKGDLSNIQFIDMKKGINDGLAIAQLSGALDRQGSLIRKLNPLWQPKTAKPEDADELVSRADGSTDVDTPVIVVPSRSHSSSSSQFSYLKVLVGVVSLVAVSLVIIFAILQAGSGGDVSTATAIAQATLNNPTAVLTSTPTESQQLQNTESELTQAADERIKFELQLTETNRETIATLQARETELQSRSNTQEAIQTAFFDTQTAVAEANSIQQTQVASITETFSAEPTSAPVIPTYTDTPLPTLTPIPTQTDTPLPTLTPIPTHTDTPLPTSMPIPTVTPRPSSTPQPETKYAAQNAIIRSGPKLNASVVGSAEAGRSVSVMGQVEGDRFAGNTVWYYVQHRNPMTGVTHTGYTHSSLLSNTRPIIVATQVPAASAPNTVAAPANNAPINNAPAGGSCSNGGMSGTASGLFAVSGKDRRTISLPANATVAINAAVTDGSGAWGVRIVLEDASGKELNYREIWSTSGSNQTGFTYTITNGGTYRVGINGDSTHTYRYSISWRCQ